MNGSRAVDVEGAWRDHQHQPLVVTSKLMSSLSMFSGVGYPGMKHFEVEVDGMPRLRWGVEGKAILSTSEADNPDFHQHNHVLVPYCSSDLWLKKTNDFMKARSPNFRFHFDPLQTDHHQFTFRGAAIFRGVVQDLFDFHGLSSADEVVLAGSSAGGVGAMNHAHWLQYQLQTFAGRDAKLYVLIDSAWFIDFRGEISNVLPPEDFKALVESDEIIESCSPTSEESDLSQSEGLACLSAHFFLSLDKFPADVPVLVIFSRYDLYILVQALATIVSSLGKENPVL